VGLRCVRRNGQPDTRNAAERERAGVFQNGSSWLFLLWCFGKCVRAVANSAASEFSLHQPPDSQIPILEIKQKIMQICLDFWTRRVNLPLTKHSLFLSTVQYSSTQICSK
jgi:hypothetical protein